MREQRQFEETETILRKRRQRDNHWPIVKASPKTSLVVGAVTSVGLVSISLAEDLLDRLSFGSCMEVLEEGSFLRVDQVSCSVLSSSYGHLVEVVRLEGFVALSGW